MRPCVRTQHRRNSQKSLPALSTVCFVFFGHFYCSGDGKRRSAANKKSLNHGHLLPRVEHARTTPCNPSTQQRRNIFPALGEVT
jgi:hypothetical protein